MRTLVYSKEEIENIRPYKENYNLSIFPRHFPDDSFESDVREFLTQKNNEKPTNNLSNVDDDVDG